MTAELVAVCFDAHDPDRLARFWSGLLGWERVPERETDGRDDSVALLPSDGTGFRLRFVRGAAEKAAPNRIHLDLTSATDEDQRETIDRALALGGSILDLGLGPQERHVPLADPEGNELCVIEADNRFLAGCGAVGAINCDGSRRVGHFWSDALGWPLVWDQDEETAIQSPLGGTKIAWGGPPVAAKTGKGRVHLDLAAHGDHDVEVDRLLSLGATRLDVGQGGGAWTALADPDGNEFCVVRRA